MTWHLALAGSNLSEVKKEGTAALLCKQPLYEEAHEPDTLDTGYLDILYLPAKPEMASFTEMESFISRLVAQK